MSAEYTTYFRNLWQKGCCIETHRDGKLIVECDVTEADVEIYPSLKGRKRVVFVETESGFEETSEVGGGKKKTVAAKRKKKKASKKKVAKKKPTKKASKKKKAPKKKATKKKAKKKPDAKKPAAKKPKAKVHVDVSIGGAAENKAERAAKVYDKARKNIMATLGKTPVLEWRVTQLLCEGDKCVYSVVIVDKAHKDTYRMHLGNFLAKNTSEVKKKARAAFKKRLGK